MKSTLVLLAPNKDNVSETFIRSHRDLLALDFNLITLYRWRPPYKLDSGGYIGIICGLIVQVTQRLFGAKSMLYHLTLRIRDKNIAKWLIKVKPIAVMAEYGPLGSNIAGACEFAGIPLITIFHGYDAFQRDTLDFYREDYRRLFCVGKRFVVVSRSMASQLAMLGASPGTISVNPCGVDPSDFVAQDPSRSSPHFVALHRLVGKKGTQFTIRAFFLLLAEVPNATLTILGDGPERSHLEALVRELHMEQHVLFAGAVTPVRVREEFARARALVQHSVVCESGDREGTPVAVIEAQMSALPVIATRHEGIIDVIEHGKTGFLVEERDVEAMATYMRQIANDPKLAWILGKAARIRAVERFSLAGHISKLRDLINQVALDHVPTSEIDG